MMVCIQAEPMAEVVKQQYVAPIASIVTETVRCSASSLVVHLEPWNSVLFWLRNAIRAS